MKKFVMLSVMLVVSALFAQSVDIERMTKLLAEQTAKAAAEQAVKDAADKAAKAAADKAAADAKAAAEKAVQEIADKRTERDKKLEDRRMIETRIFKLIHANAEEVAAKFNEMWSGDFGTNWKIAKIAVAFVEANSVMVTAPRHILDACEKAIAEIDVEAAQVYIEARFVELGNYAGHKVGIDWKMLYDMRGTAGLGAGIKAVNVGKGISEYIRRAEASATTTEYMSFNPVNGSDGSISFFNGTLDFSQMSLTLSALEATDDAKTFSNPKIIVSSGKKATVDMTTKYPNVKISAKRTTSGGGADSLDIAANMDAIPGEDKRMFAKEAFFSWGISLDVTPRISTNGLINVEIVPTISSQESWVETGTGEKDGSSVSAKYPVIKVQRLITEFNLESGTTAVIGGLSITEETQEDTGIPLLRNIPWIGRRLFGSSTRVKQQKEIVVFVTVGVVNPRKVEPDAGLPKNAVLGRQYIKGQKLEPGDRPEKNMEGMESLDMRTLDEQAQDPLQQQPKHGFKFSDIIPFSKSKDSDK